VVFSLVDEELGKEVIFYGRPKEKYPNRAKIWVEDLKTNTLRRPRILGTNDVEDMVGLDVIFFGAGVPRKEGPISSTKTGKSASAGPSKAACDMLRCIIRGELSLLSSKMNMDSSKKKTV